MTDISTDFSDTNQNGNENFLGKRLESDLGPLGVIQNVEMEITVELGRAKMSVRELLSLTSGDVVELDRLATSPVDVLVNGTLVARAEVVVVEDEFGIRITEVVGRDERSDS
ncbi:MULTISPECIES: flagellar motor switch protein FliN [Acidithrix]|uniref:Flagellar motor switch protein FliN n=1 Tax=Acidithrix ferrooxidans TaxID=1280514 RepID=A0A0D8HFH8_9ACTN|nr:MULTISPECIES: flagellar motor switch protein FliN [Acidithrix]KJF16542.1 flagellar motor switch protein FliN [Acidithrix ferrooxidans]CAG4933261.1 unnamed protein product [Acidithrix sp. C25]